MTSTKIFRLAMNLTANHLQDTCVYLTGIASFEVVRRPADMKQLSYILIEPVAAFSYRA